MEYLFGHDEKNPVIVQDYPYGFRLRTQMKVWLETTPKKGDRFCTQTLNPKNGRWNAEKKSTYACIGVMFKDEKGHIKWDNIGIYDSGQKTIDFVAQFGGPEKLNPEQKKMYNSLLGINEVKTDEFSGKVKKDFAVKWEKDNRDKEEMREVRITFDRPDRISVKEIFLAMKTLNQDKLNEVFKVRHSSFGDYPGTVRICVRGGSQITTVTEEAYKEFLASDYNTALEEKGDL